MLTLFFHGSTNLIYVSLGIEIGRFQYAFKNMALTELKGKYAIFSCFFIMSTFLFSKLEKHKFTVSEHYNFTV